MSIYILILTLVPIYILILTLVPITPMTTSASNVMLDEHYSEAMECTVQLTNRTT